MSIQTTVGSPGAIGGAGGAQNYAYDLTTTPQVVLLPDPQRVSITFHNPGAVDIFIAPTNIQNSGSDVVLAPTTSDFKGCWRLFANGGSLTINGECQKRWQAFCASGTNPLTIIASRI
jgi:hypothetical protein